MNPLEPTDRAQFEEQHAELIALGRALKSHCRVMIDQYKAASHPFNDKFGDDPASLRVAEALEQAHRNLLTVIDEKYAGIVRAALTAPVAPAAAPSRPSAPKRAYRLTLELGADTARDMAWALRNLGHRIEREQVGGAGTWGSPTDGANYELLTDQAMTHERFFEDLNAYLAALEKPVVSTIEDAALPLEPLEPHNSPPE